MASEKAKELARKQKAEVQAEKLRKRQSDDPKDWGQLRQTREMFKLVKQENPRFPLLFGLAIGLPIVVAVVVCLFVGFWSLIVPFGVLLGLVLGLLLFNREIKTATFSRVQGQAGSAQVALQMLPKGWTSSPPINANRDMDVIHRAIGPAGLVLVGEGDAKRLRPMLSTEVKRHSTASHNLVVTSIVMGDGEGQVPLNKLTDHIRKLPKQYDAAQVADIQRRVTALDNVRPRLGGMPRGPINTRGARKAMRGR